MCVCTVPVAARLMTLVLAAVNDRINLVDSFDFGWRRQPKNCIDSVIALIIFTLLYYVKLIN